MAQHDFVIRQRGAQWCVLTEDESRTLGCHDSEEKAQAQLRAIEASKHMATELKGIEVFAAGIHNGDPYTTADLDAMVSAYKEAGITPPYKRGHTKDPGAPAIGWIKDLRREGSRLLADIGDVPQEVYDAIKARRYGTHSAEVVWDAEVNGKKYPKFLKGVALLGADVPAVPNLKPAWESIQGLKWGSERAYAFDVDIPNGPQEVWFTVKEMEAICPPCAEKMAAAKITKVKVFTKEGKFAVDLPQGTIDALCARFGPAEGFRTRCMEHEVASRVDDPGAFCNALKDECGQLAARTGTTKETTMDAADEAKIKEYEAKIAELTAALAEQKGDEEHGFGAAAIRKMRTDLESVKASNAELKKAQRDNEITGKVKSVRVPVFRKYVQALYEALTTDQPRTVQFSMDGGKTAKPTPVLEVLDGFVASINRQTDHLFKELTVVGDALADRDEVSEDAGVEADRRARKYMTEKGEKDYSAALSAVLDADPDLKSAYANAKGS